VLRFAFSKAGVKLFLSFNHLFSRTFEGTSPECLFVLSRAALPTEATSQWSGRRLDDDATAELMGRFYRAMEQDAMRPAAALRQAQIELWKQQRWNAPYYWAAFTLQGE
jgi:hypothetical protein